MKRYSIHPAALFALVLLAGCGGGGGPASTLPVGTSDAAPATPLVMSNVIASCANPLPGDEATCFALQRTDVGDAAAIFFPNARDVQAATSAGYGPSDLQSAYALPSGGGSGQTVGIVDAYDDPNAEADLGVYRAKYNLPPCTTANGCFRKLNQTGAAGSYPSANSGWGQEISLDVDMVSAVCPNCKIVLVEAKNATFSALGTAVDTAVAAGANVVSNSYGGNEYAASDANYTHSGAVIVAAAGDDGYGPEQPATFATVVAAGGTTLSHASNARGWSETVWSDSGSGCSAIVAKPSWQTDQGCTKRSESDVSAVADPNTGVAVYDSYGPRGETGWLVFGGTSVATPIISSTFALAGNASSQNAAQGIWQNAGKNLNDVTSGSNGRCSKAYPYMCAAGAGYDGPTGWGTPSGTGAF